MNKLDEFITLVKELISVIKDLTKKQKFVVIITILVFTFVTINL